MKNSIKTSGISIKDALNDKIIKKVVTKKSYRSYKDKLQDPKWQKKRLEILNRDNWKCQKCGDENKTLHVHHIEYKPCREPWQYDNENFVTLCYDCHYYVEQNIKYSKSLEFDKPNFNEIHIIYAPTSHKGEMTMIHNSDFISIYDGRVNCCNFSINGTFHLYLKTL